AAPAPAPLHVREAELGQAEGGGQARRVVAVVAIGGEAVHLAGIDARIVTGAKDRLQRQRELGLGRPAVLVVGRLPHPDDRDLPSDAPLPGHRSSGLVSTLGPLIHITEHHSVFGTSTLIEPVRLVTPDLGEPGQWGEPEDTGRNGSRARTHGTSRRRSSRSTAGSSGTSSRSPATARAAWSRPTSSATRSPSRRLRGVTASRASGAASTVTY